MNIELKIDDSARREDGLAQLYVSGISQTNLQLDMPFDELLSFGQPNAAALELLIIAATAYAVDKSVRRADASDAWTRKLSLTVPSSRPARWNKASEHLSRALSFLSGDDWEINFASAKHELFVAPSTTRQQRGIGVNQPTHFDAVCLFSGGLDSLIGAIDFLAENPRSNLLLLGHYDFPGPKSQQRALADGISAAYPTRIRLVQVRVSQKPRQTAETTLRTRSIVFFALGLYLASALGVDVPLLAPENGLIALNMPLTNSRIGSCSTRTMHPFYLKTVASLLQEISVENKIVNPMEFKTKADCVSQCRDPKLLRKLAPQAVSCSHGSRRQHWERRNVANCGYCVPCLYRRVSLHAAHLDAGRDYGIDIGSEELTPDSDRQSAADMRALISSLHTFTSRTAIRKSLLSVASINPLEAYVEVVDRGLNQIREWVAAKGSKALRRYAGLD